MTIQEAIKNSGTFAAMSKGSIKKAESLLTPQEEVITACVVNIAILPSSKKLAPSLKIKNKINGVLVVTTTRVLFCNSVLGKGITKEIPITAIQSVDTSTTLMGISALRIVGLTEMFIVDGIAVLHTNIATAIQQAQGQAHAPQVVVTQSASFSVADELTKFKQLLDEGVITQEEFDAKKQHLLGL